MRRQRGRVLPVRRRPLPLRLPGGRLRGRGRQQHHGHRLPARGGPALRGDRLLHGPGLLRLRPLRGGRPDAGGDLRRRCRRPGRPAPGRGRRAGGHLRRHRLRGADLPGGRARRAPLRPHLPLPRRRGGLHADRRHGVHRGRRVRGQRRPRDGHAAGPRRLPRPDGDAGGRRLVPLRRLRRRHAGRGGPLPPRPGPEPGPGALPRGRLAGGRVPHPQRRRAGAPGGAAGRGLPGARLRRRGEHEPLRPRRGRQLRRAGGGRPVRGERRAGDRHAARPGPVRGPGGEGRRPGLVPGRGLPGRHAGGGHRHPAAQRRVGAQPGPGGLGRPGRRRPGRQLADPAAPRGGDLAHGG